MAPQEPRPASRPALAPDPAPPGAFLPAGYQGELFVDWARVRDIGLLEALQRLPMAEEFFAWLARDQGGDLDHLARVRTAFAEHGRHVRVAELTSGAPRPPAPQNWSAVRIGSYDGFRGPSDQALLWPAADLAVGGSADLLEDIVAGRQPTGGPHPDLVPLLAGDGVLVQAVYGRFDHPYDGPAALAPLAGDRDDPADFVRLRLQEDPDGSLVASLTLRFRRGSSGLRAAEEFARTRLQAMREEQRFSGFRQLLADVVVLHTRRDLTASLSLGPPRNAVATAERTALALMALMQQEERDR